jgi:hypothetical protein
MTEREERSLDYARDDRSGREKRGPSTTLGMTEREERSLDYARDDRIGEGEERSLDYARDDRIGDREERSLDYARDDRSGKEKRGPSTAVGMTDRGKRREVPRLRSG